MPLRLGPRWWLGGFRFRQGLQIQRAPQDVFDSAISEAAEVMSATARGLGPLGREGLQVSVTNLSTNQLESPD